MNLIRCEQIRLDGSIGLGEVSPRVEYFRQGILSLLNLAPEIQEQILFLPRTTVGRGEIQEKAVRRIAMEFDWEAQASR